MKEEKRQNKILNLPAIILSIFGAFVLILAILFVYFSINGPNYTSTYNEKIQKGEIKNPITEFGLIFSEEGSEELEENDKVIKINTEEGEKLIIIKTGIEGVDISKIEEKIVEYVSVVLKLYNLHNIPFTTITPKIQLYIDENAYYAEITKGNIIVKDGETNKKDIIIRTTHEEIFKMIEDENYAEESLSSGKTSIELIANKVILFSKGYLSLYEDLSKNKL